jgi:hypothetical protein
MDPVLLQQLSTAEGMREVVKARWVDAQPAVVPHLESHRVAAGRLSAALADVDPNPSAYLRQVLKAKLREHQAWAALSDVRQKVGLEFDRACPLGTGFDWAAYDRAFSAPGAACLDSDRDWCP